MNNRFPPSENNSDLPSPEFQRDPTYGSGAPQQRIAVKAPDASPAVTYSLIGITVVVFLLQLVTKSMLGFDLPVAYGAKVNNLIQSGQYWRLISPVFLHGSILHIGFNMYALYLFGRQLERYYGHGRFLLLYLLGGFGGNVISMMFTDAPSLGASTAIFGLLAAQGVFIYQNRALFGGMTQRALQSIIMVAAVNLLIGLSPGIDNWGHIGGLVAGLVFSWIGGPILAPEGGYPYVRLINQRDNRDVLLASAVTAGFFIILAAGAMFLMGR